MPTSLRNATPPHTRMAAGDPVAARGGFDLHEPQRCIGAAGLDGGDRVASSVRTISVLMRIFAT